MTGRVILIGILCACWYPAAVWSQDIDSEAPFRIPDRPARPEKFPPNILPEEKNIVQIHGRWVEHIAQCRQFDGNPPPDSVFLTNTLIRWNDTTCNIRDIQKTDAGAKLSAVCGSSADRRRETLTLIREGPDLMQIKLTEDGRPVFLTRCPM